MAVTIARGMRLHFVGDSLTAFGWYSAPGGLVDRILAVPAPEVASLGQTTLNTPAANSKTIVSGGGVATSRPSFPGPSTVVTQSGVGGNRIHDVITDGVAGRITSLNPDVVFMEFGINDWTNATAQAAFQADYASTLDQCIAWRSTVQIVCLSTYFHTELWQTVAGPANVWQQTYGNVYDSTILALCAARAANCTYVDLATPAAAYVAALTPPAPGQTYGIISDVGGVFVHPNLNGQLKMADFIWPSLNVVP